MENLFYRIADHLELPISTIVLVFALWCFFKNAILNEIKKQTEKDLISLQSECNKEVLTSIEEQKAKLQEGLNKQNSLLEANVLSAIEKQKAEMQKDLNKQIADFQVELTRYSFLKEKEIDVYKIYYGKLLKAYFRLKNYVTYGYGSVDLASVGNEVLIEHINNLKINERLKDKVIQAVTKRTDGYEKLFKKAELYHNCMNFREVNVEQEEYFLEHELFFAENICENVRSFQSKMDNIDKYFNFAEEHGYLVATVFYGSNFEKSPNEKDIKEYVKNLYGELDAIKMLIKKEIYEH